MASNLFHLMFQHVAEVIIDAPYSVTENLLDQHKVCVQLVWPARDIILVPSLPFYNNMLRFIYKGEGSSNPCHMGVVIGLN